jgi:hypothetical protein
MVQLLAEASRWQVTHLPPRPCPAPAPPAPRPTPPRPCRCWTSTPTWRTRCWAPSRRAPWTSSTTWRRTCSQVGRQGGGRGRHWGGTGPTGTTGPSGRPARLQALPLARSMPPAAAAGASQHTTSRLLALLRRRRLLPRLPSTPHSTAPRPWPARAGKGDIKGVMKLVGGAKGSPTDKLRLAIVHLLSCDQLPTEPEYAELEGELRASALPGRPWLGPCTGRSAAPGTRCCGWGASRAPTCQALAPAAAGAPPSPLPPACPRPRAEPCARALRRRAQAAGRGHHCAGVHQAAAQEQPGGAGQGQGAGAGHAGGPGPGLADQPAGLGRQDLWVGPRLLRPACNLLAAAPACDLRPASASATLAALSPPPSRAHPSPLHPTPPHLTSPPPHPTPPHAPRPAAPASTW